MPAGSLKPEEIHLQHIFVKRIIKGTNYKKPVEKMTVIKADGKVNTSFSGEA